MRKLPLNLVNKKISRQRLIQAFNWRLGEMEAEKDKSALASSGSPRVYLQSMKDIERAHDGLEEERASLQTEREMLEADRVASNGGIKEKREKLEAERVARKAVLKAEREQREAEREEKK